MKATSLVKVCSETGDNCSLRGGISRLICSQTARQRLGARFPRSRAEFRRWRRLISFSFRGREEKRKQSAETRETRIDPERETSEWLAVHARQLGPRQKNSHTANTEERSIKRHSTAIIK